MVMILIFVANWMIIAAFACMIGVKESRAIGVGAFAAGWFTFILTALQMVGR